MEWVADDTYGRTMVLGNTCGWFSIKPARATASGAGNRMELCLELKRLSKTEISDNQHSTAV